MELWNDFEGKNVDGRFQLDHLIGPKGRSAYFTTRDETGGPAVIRLIESLNDEEEILSRWRAVTGLRQENLVAVLACGQTVIDGTHLVYAVMEPTDAELADVLRERALTADETRQIALSVADGLEVLHAKGLVHEHVEAENVLATGETVKLRSDVVRQAPEGAEGEALRAKDVRDLALLVVQSLTRRRQMGETRLPVPFDEVARKGESGAWGLREIVAALRPGAAVSRPVVAGAGASVVRPGVPVRVVGRPGTSEVPAANGAAAAASASAAGIGRSVGGAGAADAAKAGNGPGSAAGVPATATAPSNTPAAVASRLANQATAPGEGLAAHLRSPRAPDRIILEPGQRPNRSRLLAAVAAVVLLLVALGVYLLRGSHSGPSGGAVQNAPSAVAAPQQGSESQPTPRETPGAPVPQRVGEKPSAAVESARAARLRGPEVVTGASSTNDRAQWRVVAYTYNRESQAGQKAQAIATRHPGLKPEVFSPSGRAPYLVTLGGWMTADQAGAVRNKARSEGLPRDVYTRNYRAKSR